VNLATKATAKTITLNVKIKYLAILFILANLKNKIKLIEIKRIITAPNPAFNPKIFIKTSNPSSTVEGIVNSETEILSGIANLITLAAALKENIVKITIDTALACLFMLGKRFLIPLPKIAPCIKPIPMLIPNEITKFSSAIDSRSKVLTLLI